MPLNKKIGFQNNDLRFFIHKIAQSEKSQTKIEFALMKRNLPLKYKFKF